MHSPLEHMQKSCADPESFVRGCPNLIMFFLGDEGIEDPNTTIMGHHRLASETPFAFRWRADNMAFRWRADDGPTLNAGFKVALWFFRGSRPVLRRNPIFFVIFQGGPDPLSPLWIRT